jgi:hypothetical protein
MTKELQGAGPGAPGEPTGATGVANAAGGRGPSSGSVGRAARRAAAKSACRNRGVSNSVPVRTNAAAGTARAELELRFLLVVARAQGRPGAVGEPLARQEVCLVGPARDVDDVILVRRAD